MKKITQLMIFALGAMVFSNVVFAAQETRTNFKSGVTTNLASGSNITAADLRTEMNDLADSCFFLSDETSDDITQGSTNLLMTPAERTKLFNLPATITEAFIVPASAETGDLTTGTGKVTFRMPYAFTVTAVRASVKTAPTGATVTVDINEGGTSILSTALTIDAGETTSTTAATPAVISDAAIADDAEITIDVDQIGSTIAGEGLKITLIGNKQ